MTTTDERTAFLLRIAAEPGCDTARLVYADWLDEHGEPDRAEFIRSQCEVPARLEETVRLNLKCKSRGCDCWGCTWLRREGELLRSHPEWSRCPCPACEGRGTVRVDTGVDWPAVGGSAGGRLHRVEQCPTCRGTGDLFIQTPPSGVETLPPNLPRTVTFARGFPDSVTCRLEELVERECTGCGGRARGGDILTCRCPHASNPIRRIPTPWARAVVRQTPVVRFRVTDRTPEHSMMAGWFRWFTGTGSNEIPFELFRELEGEYPTDQFGTAEVPYWRTADLALDALAPAAGRVVRRAVYGKGGAK